MHEFRKAAALGCLAFVLGCFQSTELEAPGRHGTGPEKVGISGDKPADPIKPNPDSLPIVPAIPKPIAAQDSVLDHVKPVVIWRDGIGGWDDFPNKYKPQLERLAGQVKSMPIPLDVPIPQSGNTGLNKVAAAACIGDQAIDTLYDPGRTTRSIDTVSYYDLANARHCVPQDPTTREDHWRSVSDTGSGEAWDRAVVLIQDNGAYSKRTSHTWGYMNLKGGMTIQLDTFDVELDAPKSGSQVTIHDARLKMLLENGMVADLNLAKPTPYLARGLFPLAGDASRQEQVLFGPIFHVDPAAGGRVDTVGYMSVYANRKVRIYDWTGALMLIP